MQASLESHTTPQPPQLFRSEVGSTQTPLHGINGKLHDGLPLHIPFAQYVPPAQAFPHAPQLLLSVDKLTQTSPQRV